MELGEGTYAYLGKVYSQYQGVVEIQKAKSAHELDKISVIKEVKEIEEVLGRVENFAPESGQLVYARVIKVEDRFAKVEIVAVAD